MPASPSSRLLLRLLATVGALDLSAACKSDDETPKPWSSLSEVPAAASGSYPDCGTDQSTPGGFGYHGSCCMDVVCQAPDTKTGQCADPSTVHRGVGSGTCGCGTTLGPFQADAAHQGLTTDGQGCCYVAGIIGCDGRPLFVDGMQRKASLRAEGGWA